MKLRWEYFWPMGSPEMDSTRPLLASESVRASRSEACSPFFMGSSLWKTSSAMTESHHHDGDQIQMSCLRLRSVSRSSWNVSGTWGGESLWPQTDPKANGSVRSTFGSQPFQIWLTSVEFDCFCNFVAFCQTELVSASFSSALSLSPSPFE